MYVGRCMDIKREKKGGEVGMEGGVNKRKKGEGKKVYKGRISGKRANIKSVIVRGSKRMLKRRN